VAVRRDTIRKQFLDAVQSHLEPGEQLVAGALCASGPSPWLLSGLFGYLGMLLGVRWYFVWISDRRVLFLSSSMATGRPKGFAWSDMRAGARATDVHPAATWSWFRYTRPAGGKPLRLNFGRPWREDFAAMTSALGSTSDGGASTPPAAGGIPSPPPGS
jgi:hypothetical protein